MTDFDLLYAVGEVEDRYILESRRRPPKAGFPWRQTLAACLVLAALGGAGRWVWAMGQGATAQSEETVQTATEAPAGQAPAAVLGTENTDYQVNLLAAAEYPKAIGQEEYEELSRQWQDNQISDSTKTALSSFAYSTAAAVLQGGEESGCYSPLSLYQTLAILASGAQGQTQAELLSLLGQEDVDTLAQEAGRLYRANYFDNEINQLKIANSLWLGETTAAGSKVSYNQDWVLSAAANYYASVYQADFSREETALALGQWIAENTGGQLQPSPAQLGFEGNTVMAIVNALYYKTQWANQISKDLTTTGDFTTGSGQTVSADFMHATRTGSDYLETEEYLKSSLELNQGQMTFVLPKEGVDVDSLLTEEKLWEIFENGDYQRGDVIWSVPKFETGSTYSGLAQTLQDLGITSAFDAQRADFTGISSDTPLYVGKIQQGTHIAVNEDGVEASAFSLAEVLAGEGAAEECPQVEMNLNRPFLYLITARDGSPLFLGVVREPGE